ncbi:hypothetical protein J8273_1140 [Carpediemonas membranifera]|uniref:Uncharacterized protein n=1 Tax=Carpediemonas membranifera TaxID=201153 RepID=A0A8J6BBE3_9EUKA|nr:hypothetical protein J8273_1140 [Carpediemonas membranifera]|eukprot:KAG9397229.1 hypothetical protein J8273_1140 [Carpediemonas membranifera]
MRSSEPKSGRDVQQDAMIGLHSVISHDYVDFPGDIPNLMREAFTHEFGEDLPAALHTLNQGAEWACLLGGGADPDLEDRVLKKTQEGVPDETKMHDRIRKALTPEAKCLWFLCRKFFFTWNVAEKDGESHSIIYRGCYHHRMYMGRLFMLDTRHHTALTVARIPRALEVYNNRFTHIARTPKGLWGWGVRNNGQLGFRSSDFVDPTRLRYIFHPVAVPPGFVPDHIMQGDSIVILSMGDRQMISGDNQLGKLGLGHRNHMAGFVDLPFRVDRIMPEWFFNIFLSGRQLLFAGEVPPHIAQSGLLPGYRKYEKCLTPRSDSQRGSMRYSHLITI